MENGLYWHSSYKGTSHLDKEPENCFVKIYSLVLEDALFGYLPSLKNTFYMKSEDNRIIFKHDNGIFEFGQLLRKPTSFYGYDKGGCDFSFLKSEKKEDLFKYKEILENRYQEYRDFLNFSDKFLNIEEIYFRWIQYLKENQFVYSLSPGKISHEDPFIGFLLQKKGFCEHYATATATIFRLYGISSRVVTGFYGEIPLLWYNSSLVL